MAECFADLPKEEITKPRMQLHLRNALDKTLAVACYRDGTFCLWWVPEGAGIHASKHQT